MAQPLSPEERQQRHARAAADFKQGDLTKAELDAASDLNGPDALAQPRDEPARKRPWLWRLIRRVAWGRWD